MNAVILAALVAAGYVLALSIAHLAGPQLDALAARLTQTGADR